MVWSWRAVSMGMSVTDAVAAVDGEQTRPQQGTGLAFHGGGVHLAAVDAAKMRRSQRGIVQVEIQRTLAS